MNKNISRLFILILGIAVSSVPAFGQTDTTLSNALENMWDFNHTMALEQIDIYLSSSTHDLEGYFIKVIVYNDIATNLGNGKINKKKFMSLLDSAKSKANDLIKQEPNNIDFQFYLGGLYFWETIHYMSVGGGTWSIVSSAKKSREYFSNVIGSNPINYDAYYGLGAINCYATNLPKIFKLFSGILNLKGDITQGVEELSKAMACGHYTTTFAQLDLSRTYFLQALREKDSTKATEYLNEGFKLAWQLRQKHPRNPNLLNLCAKYCRFMKINELADTLLWHYDLISADKELYQNLNNNRKTEFHYWQGYLNITAGRYKNATDQFERMLTLAKSNADSGFVYFNIGWAEQKGGNTANAHQAYIKCLKYPDSQGSHKKAQLALKSL